MWSYVAMAAYIGFGVLMWQLIGSLDYEYQMNHNRFNMHEGFQPINLIEPGFMQDMHLVFCATIGIGSLFLLWISLSEQRGYRNSEGSSAIDRTWQPAARPLPGSQD
jgi:hypothetical protein